MNFLISVTSALMLFSALIGCGGTQYAWSSPQYHVGLVPNAVGESFWTPEVFDKSADWVINGLAQQGHNRDQMLEGMAQADVEGYARSFQCLYDTEGKLCDGQELDYKLMVAQGIIDNGTGATIPLCVWRTALMHEMIHLELRQTTGDPDAGHMNSAAWALQSEVLGPCPEN